MMLAFLGRGSGSFLLEGICIWSVQVRRVLPPSWKASPVACLAVQMSGLYFCLFHFDSAFVN